MEVCQENELGRTVKSREIIEAIMELWIRGYSIRAISKKTDTGNQCVKKILMINGLFPDEED